MSIPGTFLTIEGPALLPGWMEVAKPSEVGRGTVGHPMQVGKALLPKRKVLDLPTRCTIHVIR